MIDIALAHTVREQTTDPTTLKRPDEIRAEVDLSLPQKGLGPEAAMDKLGAVVGLTPTTAGPRFFNQLFAGREPSAGAAEMLTALLNSSMYTYKIAGVHSLIETQMIRRLCEAAGFEDGDGTFVPGGSIGNLVGMVMAAFEARPDYRDQGMAGKRLRVYASAAGHYSVPKNAGILGLGRSNVVQIPVDASGRMQADELALAIEQDLADGHQPMCVIATAGTTVAGAFDPLVEIGAVARDHGLWFHVDGCFGATFLLHSEQRLKLKGIEQADSMTFNPHKMMGVPLPCAAVLVRENGLLRKHFNEAADYLFQQDTEDMNLGTKSIQCGRRNDALKLWAAWQDLGDEGWERRIDRQLLLLNHARDRVVTEELLELACEPESLTLCFVVKDKPSDVLCDRMAEQGLAQVGFGVVGGREVVRLVTVNPELEPADIDRFFDDLLAVAKDVDVEAHEEVSVDQEETVEVFA